MFTSTHEKALRERLIKLLNMISEILSNCYHQQQLSMIIKVLADTQEVKGSTLIKL